MTRSYTDSEFDGGVSDSPSQDSPQDVYNFTFSSQDSAHWAADPYNFINSSSQDNDELSILPPRVNGGLDRFDGDFWKSSKKVKIGNSEPFTLNSSQESDELAILPSDRKKEYKNSGYANGVYSLLKGSEPYCVNSSQESDELAIVSVKRGNENARVDGVFRKSKKVKENAVLHKKKKKNVKLSELGSGFVAFNPTKTLMETQEFGEMMEHVDEVNFAVDGLKKGQPVSVRRASLLSLLSVCGTVQQRRLLRAHGYSNLKFHSNSLYLIRKSLSLIKPYFDCIPSILALFFAPTTFGYVPLVRFSHIWNAYNNLELKILIWGVLKSFV